MLVGALVAGPAGPTDDTFYDKRDDYVTNEVGTAAATGGGGAGGAAMQTHLDPRLSLHPLVLPLPAPPCLQVTIDYNAGYTAALAGLLELE